jgi:hypothetical protein
MLTSEYVCQNSTRTLSDIMNPKVRGAAFWVAHALMAQRHEDAPDRIAGPTPQDPRSVGVRG